MPETTYQPQDTSFPSSDSGKLQRRKTRTVNGVVVSEPVTQITDEFTDTTVRILCGPAGPGDAAFAVKDWANHRILDRMEFPINNERTGTRTGLESQRSSGRV